MANSKMIEEILKQEGLSIHELWDRDTPLRLIRNQENETRLKEIFGTEDMALIDAMIIEEAVDRNMTPAERQGDILDTDKG